jgi:predicted O-methyltransferase YrrM
LKSVQKILKENSLDFLFIDGDHSYEGVAKDFELYAPLVKKNGLIAFHDIVHGSPENVGGVPIFWKQLKEKHKYKEIVKDWNQGGYGIGVIYV